MKRTATSSRRMNKTQTMMELNVRLLLRNGLVSRSGMTLANTEVLKEIAHRLGYDLEKLRALDISDISVNPFAVRKARP